MKNKVTRALHNSEGPTKASSLSFTLSCLVLLHRTFTFYIVNAKLPQQCEKERTKKKKEEGKHQHRERERKRERERESTMSKMFCNCVGDLVMH